MLSLYKILVLVVGLIMMVCANFGAGTEGETEAEAKASEKPAGEAETQAVQTYKSPRNGFNVIRLITGRYYESTYLDINHYLVEKVIDDDSIEPNMEAALELMEKESRKKWPFNKRHLVDALKQFTSLTTLTKENRCNWDSYRILYKNDRAIRGRIHKPNRILRRIEYIVQQYRRQHALDCYKVYPEALKALYAKMDPVQVQRVDDFLNKIISIYLDTRKRSTDVGEISNLKRLKSLKSVKKSSSVAFNQIQLYAKNNPDVKYLKRVQDEKLGILAVSKEKVKELVKRYLIEPCKYYVTQLSPVFLQAIHDAQVITLEDRIQLGVDDRTDYYHTFARYKLCDRLIKHEQGYIIKGVIKIADKQPT